jgi:hypothetical protein
MGYAQDLNPPIIDRDDRYSQTGHIFICLCEFGLEAIKDSYIELVCCPDGK